MTPPGELGLARSEAEDDDEGMFEAANLRSDRTGLPLVVFISQRGGARHDVGVKVARGPRADPAQMVTVTVRPAPRTIPDGALPAEEFELLRRWITPNRDDLADYRTGDIPCTEDVLAALKPLPPR